MIRKAVALALAAIMVPAVVRSQSAMADPVVTYAVSTANPQAQALFNQGLMLVYAYNRRSAEAAFRKATVLDPRLAMAWWGVALSLGPNINYDMSKEDMSEATVAIAKAKDLESNASAVERQLIEALALRYAKDGDQSKLAAPYAQAMRKVAHAYPDDADIEALYLESMLDALTFHSPMPKKPGWDEIAKESAADVERWPQHIGILHYFIHLTEPNKSALALRVADTLAADRFVDDASHLVHMPSHVYLYVGDWAKMVQINRMAAQMDIAAAKVHGTEPSHLDYFFHNLSFWYGTAIMSGNESEARDAVAAWTPYNRDIAWIAEARLGHTDTALQLIDETGASGRLKQMPVASLVAYGLACAQGDRNAEVQRAIAEIRKRPGNQGDTLAISILTGKIAESTGDIEKAYTLYRKAASIQDDAGNAEDALPWYFFPRELLASLQLRTGNAAASAATAQADLEHHPNSAPALKLLRAADTPPQRS